MNNMEMNAQFFQARKFKSFIRAGQSFVDIKQTIGFSFIDDPGGYLIVQFVYDTGRALNATLRNRNEFIHLLLEIDNFIDDKQALMNIYEFIDDIEKTFNKQHYNPQNNLYNNFTNDLNKSDNEDFKNNNENSNI